MNNSDSIKIVDKLVETFFVAGKLSLKIRSEELIKKVTILQIYKASLKVSIIVFNDSLIIYLSFFLNFVR